MPKSDIFVATQRGGLCNNLKCLMSTIRLSKEQGGNVLTTCTDLAEVFSNLELIEETQIPSHAILHRDWRLILFGDDPIPKGFSKSIGSAGFPDSDPDRRNIDLEYERIPTQLQTIYFKILNSLVIRKNLHILIDGFCEKNFPPAMVSIHLRTWMTDDWDKAPKRHNSYFDIEKYETIIEKHLDSGIFLSSDNDEYAKRLVRKYGKNLVIFPHTIEFNATEYAFINLILLSKNLRLFGSCLSTFTEMAWWYSGCKTKVTLL